MQPSTSWDYFIAYATPDREVATRVYELLRGSQVFLDYVCLPPGTPWPAQIAAAHDQSHCTVLIVTEAIGQAWYTQSEYVRAIEMVREGRHVMVPLLYGPRAKPPYGTELLQAVTARTPAELPAAVQKILNMDHSVEFEPRRYAQTSDELANEAAGATIHAPNNAGTIITGGAVSGPVTGANGTAQVIKRQTINPRNRDEEAQP